MGLDSASPVGNFEVGDSFRIRPLFAATGFLFLLIYLLLLWAGHICIDLGVQGVVGVGAAVLDPLSAGRLVILESAEESLVCLLVRPCWTASTVQHVHLPLVCWNMAACLSAVQVNMITHDPRWSLTDLQDSLAQPFLFLLHSSARSLTYLVMVQNEVIFLWYRPPSPVPGISQCNSWPPRFTYTQYDWTSSGVSITPHIL